MFKPVYCWYLFIAELAALLDSEQVFSISISELSLSVCLSVSLSVCLSVLMACISCVY